jgi:outer membrane protein OmpA-like peptidoglycan-associated protein
MRDNQVEEAPGGAPEARAAPSPGDAAPPGAGQLEARLALDRVGAADGTEIVPAAAPEPAGAAGATAAANERAPISPPAPVKPAMPVDVALVTAPEAPTVAAGGAPAQPLMKPAPETPQIEVADGLVAIDVPPDDDRAIALVSIAFGPGSAALPPDASARLERLLGAANARGAEVKIVGEADAPALALDRARAVGLALVQGGLPADRLEMTLAHDSAGDRARLFLGVP